MAPTLNFGGVPPSISSILTIMPRVLSYKFGNAIEQRAPDGLNYMLEQWEMHFDNLSPTNYALLQTWLASNDPTVPFQGDGTPESPLSPLKTYWIDLTGIQWTTVGGSIWSAQFNVFQKF